jgi:hypothetical protein
MPDRPDRPPSPLPSPDPDGASRPEGDIGERLVPLVDAAHAMWASPQERRRMRAYGFVPAREQGVLKREWHGHQVRVSPERLRLIERGRHELGFQAATRALLLDGEPFRGGAAGYRLADELLELIHNYERWVEAREGREARLRRGHWSAADRRSLNALAETRRLQRLLHATWRRPPTRRR